MHIAEVYWNLKVLVSLGEHCKEVCTSTAQRCLLEISRHDSNVIIN